MRDITQLDEERSNDETRFIFDAFSALILLLTALAGNTQLYASHQQHAANTLPAGVLLPASSKVPPSPLHAFPAGAYFPRILAQTGNGPHSKAKSMAFHMGNMLSAGGKLH